MIEQFIKNIEDVNTRRALEEVSNILNDLTQAKLKFAKVRSEAIIPTKRDEDAGFDMYACVEQDIIEIKPHETVMIPTGIATCFSENYMFKLMERGSTGTKGIAQRSGVIDSGYRNEILAPVMNATDKTLMITRYMKDGKLDKDAMPKIMSVIGGKNCDIATEISKIYLLDVENDSSYMFYPMSKAITQGVLLYIPKVETEEISYDELKNIPSMRGTKAWGSTLK